MSWASVQTFAATSRHNGTPGLTTSVALGASVAVGDVVLIYSTVGIDPTTLSASTITDQLGNTWTRLSVAQGGQKYDSVDGQGCDWWYCIVTNAGTPTITYQPDTVNRTWFSFVGRHLTGSDASSTRRASAGNLQTNPGTAADAITSTSVAAQSGDLLWGGFGCPGTGSSGSCVAGTGFSGGTMNATNFMNDEWQTASGAAAATATDATGGGAARYLAAGIAISPAGGGGGGGGGGNRILLEAALGVLLLEAAAGALLLEGGSAVIAKTVPMVTVAMTTAVDVTATLVRTIPMVTIVAQASVGITGTSAKTVPMVTVAQQASVATSATMVGTVPMVSLAKIVAVPITVMGAPTVPMQQMTSSVTIPITGTLPAHTVPMLSFVSQATVGTVTTTGTVTGLVPMQRFVGVGEVEISGTIARTLPMTVGTLAVTVMTPVLPEPTAYPLGNTRVFLDSSRARFSFVSIQTTVRLDPSRTRVRHG